MQGITLAYLIPKRCYCETMAMTLAVSQERGDICHQNRLVFSDSYIPLNKDSIIYGPVGCDRNNSRVHFSRITLSARVINSVLTGNLTFLM